MNASGDEGEDEEGRRKVGIVLVEDLFPWRFGLDFHGVEVIQGGAGCFQVFVEYPERRQS